MSADRLLAPLAARAAVLAGVVCLAAAPVYIYVESPWRPAVARLAAALVLGVTLLQLRRAVADRLALDGGSPLDEALRRPEPASAVPLRFEDLISDLRTARRSRRYFERALWPRLTALAGRELVRPPSRRRTRPEPPRAWATSSPRSRSGREDRGGRRASPRGGADPRPHRGRQGRRHRAHPRGHPRQRARARRGLPRTGEDAHRAPARPGARPRLPAHPVHAGSASQRHHRQLPLRSARGPLRVPPGAGVHQSPSRRRDQPRHAQDAGRAPRGHAGVAGHGGGAVVFAVASRSSSSRPRIRSSWRAPTRCRRRSSTGSCCASPSAIPRPTPSARSCGGGASAARTRPPSPPS